MENSAYQVSALRVREVPRLNATGQPTVTILVSFMVGINGPFELAYNPGENTPARVLADIAAKVSELRQTDSLINTLNQSTQ